MKELSGRKRGCGRFFKCGIAERQLDLGGAWLKGRRKEGFKKVCIKRKEWQSSRGLSEMHAGFFL